MAARCVAHLDMDAFYVAVELRRRPNLHGKPVVVAGTGPRAVVTTASYEARRFGVGSAIPASQARRLCPHAIFLAPDFLYYRQASAEVMAIVRAHAKRVEVVGLDEAYLDLTGLGSPIDAMRGLRDQIERSTALHCSIGIGPNKLVAKVASDAEKPRGFVVLSREEARERFSSSPCKLIPGVGPRTAERLTALGVRTLGELAGAPYTELATQFGRRHAAALQSRAGFEDDTAVTQERKVHSESRETTFDQDIASLQLLEAELAKLVRRLCEALREQRRSGRTIGIKVRLNDFSTHTRARTLADPVSEPERVGPVAADLLRAFAPERPVRLLGVRVAGLLAEAPERSRQLSLPVG